MCVHTYEHDVRVCVSTFVLGSTTRVLSSAGPEFPDVHLGGQHYVGGVTYTWGANIMCGGCDLRRTLHSSS